jgi:hypothetical protein
METPPTVLLLKRNSKFRFKKDEKKERYKRALMDSIHD